jgi:hypothetical protein
VTEYLSDQVANAMAAEKRHQLNQALPERESFVARGYDSQDAELASSRARLSDRARAGSAAARVALERVKEHQRTLANRKERALAELRREPERIAVGSIHLIANALAIPSADPEERKRHDAEVEALAMQVARTYEEGRGAVVRDVSTPPKARVAGLADNPGFDLLASYPDRSKRAIEVKGRAGVGDIEVTENEWAEACNLRHNYWLYTVLDCGTPFPRLVRVRDPFGRLLTRAKGSVIVNVKDVMAAGEAEEA